MRGTIVAITRTLWKWVVVVVRAVWRVVAVAVMAAFVYTGYVYYDLHNACRLGNYASCRTRRSSHPLGGSSVVTGRASSGPK